MTNKVTIINDGPYVIDVIRGGLDLIRLHPNVKFETYHWIGTDIIIKEAEEIPSLKVSTPEDIEFSKTLTVKRHTYEVDQEDDGA